MQGCFGHCGERLITLSSTVEVVNLWCVTEVELAHRRILCHVQKLRKDFPAQSQYLVVHKSRARCGSLAKRADSRRDVLEVRLHFNLHHCLSIADFESRVSLDNVDLVLDLCHGNLREGVAQEFGVIPEECPVVERKMTGTPGDD